METSPKSVDATRDFAFDQAVDEQKQLEQEVAKKPENEKLKTYLTEVRDYIDKLLAEVDAPTERSNDKVKQSVGQAAVQSITANELQDAPVEAAPQPSYVDSQGFVHDTPQEAIQNDVARENNINAANQ